MPIFPMYIHGKLRKNLVKTYWANLRISWHKKKSWVPLNHDCSNDIVPLKNISARPSFFSIYILREKSLAIYFGDSQFRRNRNFNFIVSKIYVDKRS